MKQTLLIVALAVAVVMGLLSLPAFAHDLRISALDGGLTATAISPKIDYTLQCTGASCYRITLDGGAADCSVDYNLQLSATGGKYEREFNGGAGGLIRVYALDAGAPGCQLYQKTK